MKDIQFPIFKTKIPGPKQKFDLADPKERTAYFELKAGKEIRKLRNYFKKNIFIAYLFGKKNSGKGTYARIFAEVVDKNKIDHISIGDIVRGIDVELKDKKKKEKLVNFLERNYRGWLSLKEVILTLEKRSTKTLLPTELILALVKREIEKRKKKAIFIDGFPRDLDQISLSLFFRELIGYREDPDIFVLIDVPEKVIDERIKYRVVCPKCQSTRNLKLHPVANGKIKYNEERKEFYFNCENPNCRGIKMVRKEGDEAGIGPIRERLKKDEKLIKMAFSLYGIPKILLRNSLPLKKAKEFVDDYEITPEYVYEWDKRKKKVKIKENPWIFRDDEGTESVSLLAPAVVVSLIKQMAEILPL